MTASQRIIIIISSAVFLLLFIAISLATTIEVRAPVQKLIQATLVQAARVREPKGFGSAKARLNDTEFDRGDVWHGTSIVSGIPPAATSSSTMTEMQEGMIGFTQAPGVTLSAIWSAEGVLGPPLATASPSAIPVPRPLPAPVMPVVALTYSGNGGPKHCRGELIQKTVFPPPLEQWKSGTCVNLPGEARCGVFFSGKGDNCEAQLFNMENCYNTTRTYVNTVVFMPEERAVGALWRSMYVRCGVEVPEAKMLDPSILGDALKKPGSNNAGG
ncbi:hypothetical protein LEMA_P111260.1 [Plenodomus lingam JN3]|uniref:Uncharacterized protein n=1 Tax=Leptosphaeria maculans (strain JN3 / isolate v23.1.3 / race Av1-4-5-6-7-8) TaxID=985895 RepID=E4ZXW2_LEPMJ|nr:hypothetical protein LEMA_P111260.1 [Plenodomus lingam JN3]CBX96207.1 hypothetical protein LEMA_P111260.1 [Plenodomus lingam JN3]